jgi:hypothetical protein
MCLPVIGRLEDSTKRRGTKTMMNLVLLLLLTLELLQLLQAAVKENENGPLFIFQAKLKHLKPSLSVSPFTFC